MSIHSTIIRVSVVAAILVVSGCSRKAERQSREASGDRSTHERVSEDEASAGAVTVAELYAAHKFDGAAATRKYGKMPRVRFRADEVRKVLTGFVAVQRESAEPDGFLPIEFRLFFKESAGDWLKAGSRYTIPARVGSTHSRGLTLYAY